MSPPATTWRSPRCSTSPPVSCPMAGGCWTATIDRSLYYGEAAPASLKDVTDGYSNTALVLENSAEPLYFEGPTENPPSNWNAVQGAWIGGELGTVNVGLGINQLNFTNLYSFHPGGGHLALCDGSVHFLAAGTAKEAFYAVLVRDDGAPIPAVFWK
ncbi:MAG: DUF1559 domain-containing protein [Pirellulales bacterium]